MPPTTVPPVTNVAEPSTPVYLPSAQYPTAIVFGCQDAAGNHPIWISQWNPSHILAAQWNSTECGLVSAITIYPSGNGTLGGLMNGLAFVPKDLAGCLLPSRDVDIQE